MQSFPTRLFTVLKILVKWQLSANHFATRSPFAEALPHSFIEFPGKALAAFWHFSQNTRWRRETMPNEKVYLSF
jgi:hypothetical protein